MTEKIKRSYIIICGFADVVAGGPIYDRNKLLYMEQQGWNIVAIPTSKGKKVYIKGLEKFHGRYVPFIHDMPNDYTPKQRKKLINYLETFIPSEQSEIVIETGTDYTAYWGEELARRVKGKHIVVFLDEENSRLNRDVSVFFKYKYDRGELACISAKSMQMIFGRYWDLPLSKCYGLNCYCSNTVEDYLYPALDVIPEVDFCIGYVGRLEKHYVKGIVQEIAFFLQKHVTKSFYVVFFGGAYSISTITEIEKVFGKIPNVKIHITGYLYPLPLKALKRCNVLIAGSGSALAAAKAGVPSVLIDMYDSTPTGILSLDPESHTFYQGVGVNYIKCPLGSGLNDYLNWLLLENPVLNVPTYDFNKEGEIMSTCFGEHIRFLRNSELVQDYFNFDTLPLSDAQKTKRFLRSFLGLRLFEIIYKLRLKYVAWRQRCVVR